MTVTVSGCGKRWSLTASAGSGDGKSSGQRRRPKETERAAPKRVSLGQSGSTSAVGGRRAGPASRAGELAAQHPVRRGVARSGRVLPVGDGVVQGREQLLVLGRGYRTRRGDAPGQLDVVPGVEWCACAVRRRVAAKVPPAFPGREHSHPSAAGAAERRGVRVPQILGPGGVIISIRCPGGCRLGGHPRFPLAGCCSDLQTRIATCRCTAGQADAQTLQAMRERCNNRSAFGRIAAR